MLKIQPSIATIFSDCCHPEDHDANLRYKIRYTSLLGCPTETVYASEDRVAAGLLLDAVDSARRNSSLIVVNRADRSEHQKEWENGAPFGYAVVHQTFIIANPGPCLAKIGRFCPAAAFHLFDIPSIFEHPGRFDLNSAARWSQFRSNDLVPYLAKSLFEEQDVPSRVIGTLGDWKDSMEDNQVWWVDTFGNCKTFVNVNPNGPGGYMGFEEGSHHKTVFGVTLPYYERLARVPKGVAALVRGSSGIGNHRFIEVMINGGSAAKEFGLKLGSRVLK
ncbi:MAG: SAM-dependent chlorinase/fluorinase [bacterium]|nr:SAM-dependent chlorinase/fluorinase [bacterium]